MCAREGFGTIKGDRGVVVGQAIRFLGAGILQHMHVSQTKVQIKVQIKALVHGINRSTGPDPYNM